MPPATNHFTRYGAPFLTFMVAGYYGLTYITRGRIEVRNLACPLTRPSQVYYLYH